MMGVVADIFDLASIEAGREDLNKDTIDPHAVLVSAFNLVKERARQKNIRVDFDVAPDIGWITGDSRRLTQVAFNLLTNAITYTPKLGHVTLSAKRDDTWFDIIVSDSGPGIPQADRAIVGITQKGCWRRRGCWSWAHHRQALRRFARRGGAD